MNDSRIKLFCSKRCVFDDGVYAAIIVVVDEKIDRIIRITAEEDKPKIIKDYENAIVEEFGDFVLMAGVVDSHVHVNDPGRTEWEGFWTATRAAAAGGITTIVDMPLNSIPPTTTLSNLDEKVSVAEKNAFVDIGFWGGVIPGNKKELRSLIDAGVVGFKCFLLPSGVDEFPHVSLQDVKEALEELKSTGSVLAFHAECEALFNDNSSENHTNRDPSAYENFLASRPDSMEIRAIEKVAEACRSSGVRCHIVHLSSAKSLEIVERSKKFGAPLTAETCHHYLVLDAAEVPNGATEFKCCPPIRTKNNQEKLWQALKAKTLDMIVSDHSPCTENLKEGDFMSAWGGISSLQFGLSLVWTGAKDRHFSLQDISRLISANPAKLCGLQKRKGKIFVGADADFVVWQPEKKFKLTAYEGKELFGVVEATFLRGQCIYRNGRVCDKPVGNLLLAHK